MPLLRISALHKYYGDHHVLKGIDLTVEEGQVVAIIGRSGSGKSTLLRTLNGLESINDGVIEVDGEYLDAARADLRSLRQKVGMVFQQFNLFPHLTVGENVMLAPQVVQKVPKAKAAKLAGRCWNASAWEKSSTRFPIVCPAASNSGSPLPVPWRCRPRCCCATKSPRPWTRNWSTKCSAWCANWPRTA
jgi:polar amino acid transport system ATP-binding protein